MTRRDYDASARSMYDIWLRTSGPVAALDWALKSVADGWAERDRLKGELASARRAATKAGKGAKR